MHVCFLGICNFDIEHKIKQVISNEIEIHKDENDNNPVKNFIDF